MKDDEVIEAFVDGGARRAFGPTLHVEGNVLFYDGWWQAIMRIAPDTFAIRAEEAPNDSDILELLSTYLAAKGLQNLGEEFPLIWAITLQEFALGPVNWALWSTDLATGEAALDTRVGHDAFLGDEVSGVPSDPDFNAELGGARRISGLPPSLVLTIGLDQAKVDRLDASLPECRFESRSLKEVTPDICSSFVPTLMVIDATSTEGREFIMELKAAACGRVIPVVALTTDAAPPLGADAAVSPDADPVTWAQPVRSLLP
ncbi:MAG: hypothetical protein M3Z84_04895 [Actinomycetota bacterium]|nr:hypothetical protein [Actinomycetota bacterium]